MCSILGITSNKTQPAEEILTYLQRMHHRGPDGVGVQGEYATGKFWKTYAQAIAETQRAAPSASTWWIGSGLLSLTGKGNPPYSARNESETITLAHNGEIYNYRALAKKYHIPLNKSSTDSEVLVALIAAWIETHSVREIAEKLNREVRGSFAVVLHAKGKMYAFRDALGKKPIWIKKEKEKIIFSSEPLHANAELLPPLQLACAEKNTLQFETIQEKNTLKKQGKPQLENALREAIALRIAGKKQIAVSFSGGIDSALIAHIAQKTGTKVVGIGVGVEYSHDTRQAKLAAEKMGITLKWKTLSEKEILQAEKEVRSTIHSTDFLQRSVGVVNYATAKYAHALGFRTLLSGTGADELFCGYGEFDSVRENKKEAEEMREKRIHEMWKQNLWREDACSMRFGVELRTPYLDQYVVEAALAIPAWKNIQGKNGELRKKILRALAEKMGLDSTIAWYPKKAMQYGSGVAKVLKQSLR
jgi:asparagine synthase (glutamine-hydrolysing)